MRSAKDFSRGRKKKKRKKIVINLGHKPRFQILNSNKNRFTPVQHEFARKTKASIFQAYSVK